jgi:hypothetical protein
MSIIGAQKSKAQDSNAGNDTIPAYLGEVKSDVEELKKFKITGYIQAQAQFADSAGIPAVAGGAFPTGVDKRFMVRRGRLKFTYSPSVLTSFVLQIDATEKGVILKDAYVKFTEPWLRRFTLTSGVFNRPFGYEIEFSSSNRESPERSRFTQTLFPNERDMGFMLTYQPPKTSRYNWLKLDAGLFNGTGPNTVEFDNFKNFIGHLSVNKSLLGEKIKLSGGVSLYSGGFANGTNKVYVMNGTVFNYIAADTLTNLNAKSSAKFTGLDAQFSYDSPIGITTIRGEYIWGQQAAYQKVTVTPLLPLNVDTYIRNMAGYYVYFVQNIGHSKHQFIFKYDSYDPNTRISGTQIGVKGSNTSVGDIKFSTIGLGWAFRWDSNIKLTAYYDIITNESTVVKGYTKDIKDNVLTMRVQYKF